MRTTPAATRVTERLSEASPKPSAEHEGASEGDPGTVGPGAVGLARRVCRQLLALALLVLCATLLWTSEQDRTLTADESLHLMRGEVWLWKHSARLSYAHPPLANVVTALPHAGKGREPWGPDRRLSGALDPEAEFVGRAKRRGLPSIAAETPRADAVESLSRWAEADPLRISEHYFLHDFRRAHAELTASRRVMMGVTLAFGLFFYLWIQRRYGWEAAILSLALFSLHPTLIAHGRLVTTDVPAMATVFVSLTATIAWVERPTWGRVAWFLSATTAMVLTKHSGLLFVLVLSGILILAAATGRGGFAAPKRSSAEPEPKPDSPVTEGARPKRWALRQVGWVILQLSMVATLMILAIDLAYFFDRVGLSITEIIAEPEPQNWLYRRYHGQLVVHSFLALIPDPVRLPFPYTWLVGLATVSKQNASGHGGYFFGLNDFHAHPLYFPVMLVVKTPLGLVALVGISASVAWRRVRAGEGLSVSSSIMLLFATVNALILVFSHINIGVRHALTLMPILIVFAGRGGALLLTADLSTLPAVFSRRWVGASVVALSLGGGVFAVGATFPHYLGYFSVLTGGPAGGRWVSIIGEDWGQDLADVAEIAHERGWTKLVYYNQFPLRREELEARGLEVEKMRCKTPYTGPDPVVIHAADWVRRTKCFTWMEDREAEYFVNYNVLVFAPVTPEQQDSTGDSDAAALGPRGKQPQIDRAPSGHSLPKVP